MAFEKLVLLAAGLLVLPACGSDDGEQAPEPPRPLALMTFNVLCSLCGSGDYDPWQERLAYFADIFARHDPDLIGLQELTPLPGEVDELLAAAPGRSAVFYNPEDGQPYPDATILYRSSRFTLIERGEYWLSPTPDEPSSTGFSSPQLPRLVVWAILRDWAGDRQLLFATTHFDNNSPSQELSAPLLLERTAPFIERYPVLVTGDFNSRPDSAAFATLTEGLSDTQPLAREWEVVHNQTPAPDYDLARRIDHIFVAGKDVEWKVSRWAADLGVYGPNGRYPSDHFPIVAVVEY
jgi:endonuclease/exonuclease/phosphatase family metal-dependent hydrolase